MSMPAIAAVLGPGERARVEAAMGEGVEVLHQESIPEAIRVVRERPVAAVLLSVSRCQDQQLSDLDRLVQGFPAIHTVAVVAGPGHSEALLRLGVGWKRAKTWITSPDPAYLRKKGRATG